MVTGSRDRTCLVWALQEDPARDRGLVPIPAVRLEAGDRVWSVAASPSASLLAVGTAATRGCPPLRLFDLASGAGVLDMGTELRNGAGMLDLAWTSPHTFLLSSSTSGTHSWMYLAPVTHSARLAVPLEKRRKGLNQNRSKQNITYHCQNY